MAADEEEKYVVAQANTPLNADGTFKDERVLVRRSPAGRQPRRPAQAQLERDELLRRHHRDRLRAAGRGPAAWTSRRSRSSRSATALIPFLEHDDANRALMGANMQKQAVPLVRAEAPYIGTGIEARAARDAADLIQADRRRRRSPRSTATRITVAVQDAAAARSTACSSSAAPTRTPASTSGRGSREGDKVAQGRRSSPTAPRPTTASWRSARTCSSPSCRGRATTSRTPSSSRERLVKDDVLTSIHIHEHEVDARDTKLGPEEITRDIPNLSDDILATSTSAASSASAPRSAPATCSSARSRPKGETELTPEERLLRAIFGEKAREVRDTSSRCPTARAARSSTSRCSAVTTATSCRPGVNQLVRVYVGPEAQDQRRRQARRPPRQQGRHLQDPPDRGHAVHGRRHRRSTSSSTRSACPSRMNVGQVLEAHLGYAARWGWTDAERRARSATTPIRGTETKTRPTTTPSHVHRHAGVRRRPLGRGRDGRQAPDDPERSSRTSTRSAVDGDRLIQHRRQDHAATTAAPARPTTTRSRSATCTS